MENIYSFSRNALLKRIGLTPGKKLLAFFISVAVLTIPLSYVYNSITLILFVLYSFLSFNGKKVVARKAMLLPMALFILMTLSLLWSIDCTDTLKALSKEAPLFFIPLVFCFNMRLPRRSIEKILNNYSFGIILFAAALLIRALVRYNQTGDTEVLFYHELATHDINAIYCSAMVSIALFHFLSKKAKTFWGYFALLFLFCFVVMLSSKTIIITDVVLIAGYYLFSSGLSKKVRTAAILLLIAVTGVVGFYSKIKDRLVTEVLPNIEAPVEVQNPAATYDVTLHDAWTKQTFGQNAYFNGAAFRLYQIRIFTEMLKEDPVFFTGYGLNASTHKIQQKAVEHDLFRDESSPLSYSKLNFHNQYVEIFADVGVFGFIILVLMLVVNLKKGAKNKDFIHIAFAVLMISLFLTESFLWRQRGIVLFTMFYCLLNTGLPPARPIN